MYQTYWIRESWANRFVLPLSKTFRVQIEIFEQFWRGKLQSRSICSGGIYDLKKYNTPAHPGGIQEKAICDIFYTRYVDLSRGRPSSSNEYFSPFLCVFFTVWLVWDTMRKRRKYWDKRDDWQIFPSRNRECHCPTQRGTNKGCNNILIHARRFPDKNIIVRRPPTTYNYKHNFLPFLAKHIFLA